MAKVSSPRLVGRNQELERLRNAVARASSGAASLVLVAGEAGIGKSRLVSAVADEVTDADGLVLMGGCLPLMSCNVPFAPITEALRSLSQTYSGPDVDGLLQPIATWMAGPHPAADVGDDVVGAGASRLFEGLLTTLLRLAEERPPVMLVIEDLHWVDGSSLDLLVFLARNLREAAVLIVATLRSDTLPVGHPVRTQIAELERLASTERIALGPLGEEDVRRHLSDLAGEEVDGQTAQAIWQRSDGNPFFVEELARIGTGAGGQLGTWSDPLRARIAACRPGTQDVLGAAAVTGRRFDQRLLEQVAALDDGAIAEALREAIDSSFLVAVADRSWDGLSFRHSLVREVIYEDLLPADRRRRHATVARVLADDPSLALPNPAGPDAEIASHWLAAGDDERALPFLMAAGVGAERVYAFSDAARSYRDALQIARPAMPIGETGQVRQPDDLDWSDLARSAARATYLAGDPTAAVALLRDAMHRSPRPAGSVEAAVDLESLGRYLGDDGQWEESLAAFGTAADQAAGLEASRVTARILASQARALGRAGQHQEAMAVARHALDDAIVADSALEEARARSALGVSMIALGDLDSGLAEMTTAHARASDRSHASVIRPAPSRVVDVMHGYADLAAILERTGRTSDAAGITRQGADVAKEMGVRLTWGSILEIHRAVGLYHTGQWDEAERLTRRLLADGLRGAAAGAVFALRARLEAGRGNTADAEMHLAAARTHAEGRQDPALWSDIAAGTAEIALWQGRLTDARLAIQDGLRRFEGDADRLPSVQLCWIGMRGEADRAERSRVRRATSEMADSAEVVSMLQAGVSGVIGQLAAQAAIAPRELRGFPALMAAEAARQLGDPNPDPWDAAVSVWRKLEDPYLMAYARWREAEALLSTKGGRPRGKACLLEAHGVAVALGAEPLRRELAAAAQRARIDLTSDGPSAEEAPLTESALGSLGLSPRELEVLLLVAQGMTNRQVATELFITEKTAMHHVSSVLSKMGAGTRMEAALIAYRAGILDEASPDRG